MKKFDFRKSVVDINISGSNFTVDLGDNSLFAKVNSIKEKALEYSTNLGDIDRMQESEIENAVGIIIFFVKESIDKLLGDGAYEDIFKGRNKSNLFDHIDLIYFILDVLTQEIMKYKSSYTDKYSVSRINETVSKGKKQ